MDLCKIYSDQKGPNRQWLVIDTFGYWAVVCRFSHLRKNIGIRKVPLFMIGNNQENGFLTPQSILNYNGEMAFPDEVISVLTAALTKFRKVKERDSDWHDIVEMVLRALESVCALAVDRPNLLRVCRIFGSLCLPGAAERLVVLNSYEAEARFINKKATIIQKAYRWAIVDPEVALCRRRLMREFHELSS